MDTLGYGAARHCRILVVLCDCKLYKLTTKVDGLRRTFPTDLHQSHMVLMRGVYETISKHSGWTWGHLLAQREGEDQKKEGKHGQGRMGREIQRNWPPKGCARAKSAPVRRVHERFAKSPGWTWWPLTGAEGKGRITKRMEKCKKGSWGWNEMRLDPSGGSKTFSWGQWGPWFLVGGHSTGTTTGLLLRTILCKSLVLVPKVKFVEKYTICAC